MAIETIQIAGFVGCSDYTPSSLAQGWQDFRTSLFYTMGDDIVQLSSGVFYETDILKMEKLNDGNSTLDIYIRTNPLDNWVMAGTVSTSSMNSFGLLFAIDNETQKGSIFTCVGIPGGYYSIDSRTTFYKNDTNDLYYVLTNSLPVPAITSNGGGATHIAKRAGLLSSIGASNLSDILMVSGGGGGGLIIGEDVYAGKDAGGIAGNGNNSANQTTGYAFGQGESAEGVSGGGGGLYGGYKGGTS